MDECKPLGMGRDLSGRVGDHAAVEARQGLTLVHFPAQRKRFLWDRGCI